MDRDKPNASGAVRIRDIADALGLSTATVSNVIHNKTAKLSQATVERVRRAIQELGYAPNMAAISLAQNYSPVVGMVVAATQRYQQAMLTDPFIGSMLDSICNTLEAHGYFLMLRRENDILNVPKYARMWKWAGVIFFGFPQRAYDDVEQSLCTPCVVMDGGDAHSARYGAAHLDNFAAGYEAGKYLTGLGHARIAFLSETREIKTGRAAGITSERYHGLAAALRKLRPDAPQPMAIRAPGSIEARRAVYDDIRRMALSGELTAVFSMADLFAVELVNSLTDAGMRLPEQLSVVGFDDIASASIVRPRLTTFRQDVQRRGRIAAELLLGMIERGEAPRCEVEPVQLIVRESACSPSEGSAH